MNPPADDRAPDEAAVAGTAATLAERIERRRADEDFQQQLGLAIERNRQALELLAE